MSTHPVALGHADEHSAEHAHPGPKTYVWIAAILTIITLLEVWAYNIEFLQDWLAPLLLALSAIKFTLVVGYFMHLKFDHPLFRAMFGFGLLLAGSIITVLIVLFSINPTDSAARAHPPTGAQGVERPAAPAAH